MSQTAPPTSATPSNDSSRERHWVYGFNAALLVAIGTIVMAFIFYFANRSQGWTSFDATSNAANSLSSSTGRLLTEIESRNLQFKIYSLFPPRDELEKRENINPDQDEHRQKVLDLLQQYAKRSKNVTVEDYGDRSIEEVRREVYTVFTPEIEPYSKVIKEFPPLADKLIAFFDQESQQVGIQGQEKTASKDQLEMVAEIQSAFKQIPDDLSKLKSDIQKSEQESIPLWTDMQSVLMRELSDEDLIGSLTLLSDKDSIKKLPLPQGLLDYLTKQSPKYKESYDELKAYIDQITKLKPLQSDDVLTALRPNTVVIIGGGTAKVISSWDIFNQKSENAPPEFDGEQTVSSAILAIARPDKVKVVFVGLSPRTLQAVTQIKSDLKDANFDPLDWSPPSAMPGGPPPDASDPPAMGKGVVWIVFPPEPDPEMAQMGMGGPGNPAPILAATKKHMDAGGEVLFMAEAAIDNPAMQLMTSPFPYSQLTDSFGIDVESRFAVVAEQSGQDPDTGKEITRTLPFVVVNRFVPHEITDPIQSFPTMMGLSRSMPPAFPTMVTMHSPMPAGAAGQVIVNSPDDAWGETNWTIDAKFDKDKDKAGPVPMAAVSIRNKGDKNNEQRIAVIGCKTIIADEWTQAVRPVNVGGQIVGEPIYPGNSELVKNTVLWLAGYENMIAVSARANQAARIGDITPGKLVALKVFVIAGLPLLALAIGGAVWLTRRR